MATLLYFGIYAFVNFNFSPIAIEVGPHYSVLVTHLSKQCL
ncbi:hypothetical protein UT300019_34840 [Clostridium sp. CTA-19]